ncbi:MAG: tetratricopeptide repeat protein [Bacteroidota bacterium]
MTGGATRRDRGQCGGQRRRRAPALLLCIWACVAFVDLAPIAAAVAAEAETERAARASFREGEAAYAAGKYADALASYQAGYNALPLPGFLVNIAQCQRRLGDLARARATYQTFIMVAPDSPLVPEVRKLVAEVDVLLAETEAANRSAPSGTAESVGRAPAPFVPATSRKGSSPSTAAVSLAAPTQVSSTPASAAPRGRRWWLWGALAVAVVGGTVAAIALSSPDATVIHDGSLGTLRR